MKNLMTALLVAGSLFMASPVMADGTTTEKKKCVQTTQYGGAVHVVCETEHKPKDAGLADVSPTALASIFFAMAGFTVAKYRKLVRSEVGL